MEITKELKNATFIYNEEKKTFTIMEADGFNGCIELDKVYAFAFMRFVVRMAQRNWLRQNKNIKNNIDKEDEIVLESDIEEDQMEFFK